ncbi:MAG: RES family NAD+ phosphorylase, partial [Candidatus Sulfotelmatobacter sp.]
VVRESAKQRVFCVERDWNFWRAQPGCRGKRVLRPHPAKRMKPQPDKATEGRVNPKGIPCLYGARDVDTAIAEIRPWNGEMVSIAVFKVLKGLKLVECLKYNDDTGFSAILNKPFGQKQPAKEDIEVSARPGFEG